MANIGTTFILALACVVTLIHSINCKPVKRSATDCYGTDCVIDQAELDFRGNPRDTELLENITGSVNHAFPEITDLLKNIAYVHKNATATALPSIAQSLEDDKNLQTSQNLLIENGTAVTTAIMLEMVRLMQNHDNRENRLLENVTVALQRVTNLLEDQAKRQDQILQSVASFLPLLTDILQIQQNTQSLYTCVNGLTSGQYMLSPQNNDLGTFQGVCDMDTDGGGWIVFQRRFDGSVDFDRVWNDYENGFGSLDGEFWIGLNKLHVITSRGRWELRVDMEKFNGEKAYAIYDDFCIGDSASRYRLDFGSYSGTAVNSMDDLRSNSLTGMQFTTKDQDNDLYSSTNCAIKQRSGWWHNICTRANLNGLYEGPDGYGQEVISWFDFRGWWPLKKTELKVRLISMRP